MRHVERVDSNATATETTCSTPTILDPQSPLLASASPDNETSSGTLTRGQRFTSTPIHTLSDARRYISTKLTAADGDTTVRQGNLFDDSPQGHLSVRPTAADTVYRKQGNTAVERRSIFRHQSQRYRRTTSTPRQTGHTSSGQDDTPTRHSMPDLDAGWSADKSSDSSGQGSLDPVIPIYRSLSLPSLRGLHRSMTISVCFSFLVSVFKRILLLYVSSWS